MPTPHPEKTESNKLKRKSSQYIKPSEIKISKESAVIYQDFTDRIIVIFLFPNYPELSDNKN